MSDAAKIDMASTGADAVRSAFRNQVAYCTRNDAPITGRLVAALGAALDQPDAEDVPFLRRIRDWKGAPLADALPLRPAGGLHALWLAGDAPELAPIFTDGPDDEDAVIVRRVIDNHHDALLPWLDGPPQTNEAGRSASFVAAMAWLAQQGLPARFDCLEIGSSAGINLMLDRYHYDLGGVSLGPDDAAMRFSPAWRGAPAPTAPIAVVGLKGCDVAPVDLTDPVQALRLKAYVWADHRERFARIETAIALAGQRAPDLRHANAADFVEAQLAEPQTAGTTRVLMHSIVWQYVPPEQQARVTAAMERAGAAATAERPLAWIALEADRTLHRHELRVRYWPGGSEARLLGYAHAHGFWIEWLG